jgi:hypothetical protein
MDVLDGLAANRADNSAVEAAVAGNVAELCARYPIYSEALCAPSRQPPIMQGNGSSRRSSV